ncbi:MAG: right-handed parallel beta-helix repeat-containing protein [Planctomycetota bacterium]|nr:right-handed parallel beta-helix repeat-containing protein [Planctomycetota bacterium]
MPMESCGLWRAAAIVLLLTFVGPTVSPARAGDNTLLPDGTEFVFWETAPKHVKTYHVAQKTAGASDDNPGSAEKPWKTIGKAAMALQPGERVLVHAGVYREAVHPERGGTGPDAMITYEAAAGEDVTITGADEWKPTWEKSADFAINRIEKYVPKTEPMPTTWVARLNGSMFAEANTFALRYRINPANQDMPVLGQIILDGKPLTQVAKHADLRGVANAFFVEDDGMSVHVRLAGDAAPEGKAFLIVTRPEIFSPIRQRLNYIRVRGFKMLYAAVPFAAPLRAALATSGGHHWVIEDNEVAYVTSRAIHLGGRWFEFTLNDTLGFDVVRRNHVHHCGLTGIAAVHFRALEQLLVEDNLVTDIGYWGQPPHRANLDEGGGIKIHYSVGSLIRRNVILRMNACPGLWLDWTHTNTRATQNLIANVKGSPFGALFVEISPLPNLIDNNILVDNYLYGAYEHDSMRYLLVANLIANGDGPAVQFLMPGRGRTFPPGVGKEYHPEGENRVYGNVLAGFPQYMLLSNPTDRSDWNVLGNPAPATQPFRFGERGSERDLDAKAWREKGCDANSPAFPLEVKFDEAKLELRVRALSAGSGAAGAFPVFPPLPPLMDRVPTMEESLPTYFPLPVFTKPEAKMESMAELLKADFLGRPRDPEKFVPGALLNMPLDGTPMKIDPRRPAPPNSR